MPKKTSLATASPATNLEISKETPITVHDLISRFAISTHDPTTLKAAAPDYHSSEVPAWVACLEAAIANGKTAEATSALIAALGHVKSTEAGLNIQKRMTRVWKDLSLQESAKLNRMKQETGEYEEIVKELEMKGGGAEGKDKRKGEEVAGIDD